MAYVQPTGVIQLFKGIALDNRYMHTIYFGSEALQDAWFTNKYNAGVVATPQSPIEPPRASGEMETKGTAVVITLGDTL